MNNQLGFRVRFLCNIAHLWCYMAHLCCIAHFLGVTLPSYVALPTLGVLHSRQYNFSEKCMALIIIGVCAR